MDFIPYKDFVQYGEDLSPNEQININHTNCEAGEDTRQRLYIKRTEDGHKLLAYCHNCGKHGTFAYKGSRSISIKTSERGIYKDRKESIGDSKETAQPDSKSRARTEAIARLKAGSSGMSTSTSAGGMWLAKAGIDPEDKALLNKASIIPAHNFVGLGIFGEDGDVIAVQNRNLVAGKPKYESIVIDNEAPLLWYSGYHGFDIDFDTTVIVEDILSAVRVAKFAKSVAILSSTPSDKVLARICKIAKDTRKIVIFLDDDNLTVKKHQLQLMLRLQQSGNYVRMITGVGKDPKECSDEELRKLLTDEEVINETDKL